MGENAEVSERYFFSRTSPYGRARRSQRVILFLAEARRTRRGILFLAGCYIIARRGAENLEKYFFHARVPMGENAEVAESYIISRGVLYYCSERRGEHGEVFFSRTSPYGRER